MRSCYYTPGRRVEIQRLTLPSAGECVEDQSSCIDEGKVKWDNHFGNTGQFLKKLNIYLPSNPAISLLGIYPRGGIRPHKEGYWHLLSTYKCSQKLYF